MAVNLSWAGDKNRRVANRGVTKNAEGGRSRSVVALDHSCGPDTAISTGGKIASQVPGCTKYMETSVWGLQSKGFLGIKVPDGLESSS